jgi:hypothetical protein
VSVIVGFLLMVCARFHDFSLQRPEQQVRRVSLPPGGVATSFQEDQPEIRKDLCRRLANAFDRMRVMVTVNSHHGAADAIPLLHQVSASAQRDGLPPYPRKHSCNRDPRRGSRVVGHSGDFIIRIRLCRQLTQPRKFSV